MLARWLSWGLTVLVQVLGSASCQSNGREAALPRSGDVSDPPPTPERGNQPLEILETPSDPDPESAEYKTGALIRAAVTAPPKSARVSWGRVLASVDTPQASKDQRRIAWMNAAMYFASSFEESASVVDLRIAHELFTGVEAESRDDFGRQAKKLRSDLVQTAKQLQPDGAASLTTRYRVWFIDRHATGTTVSLDGSLAGNEPLVVAIPVDGQRHSLRFAGAEEHSAELTWQPSSPTAPTPAIPELEPH